MRALLNFFVDICLLRAKPQDLAASTAVLGLVAVLNVLVGFLLIVTARRQVLLALGESLLEVLLMLGVLNLALKLTDRAERFYQTASAILGSSALLGLVSLPLLGWSGAGESSPAEFSALFLLLLVVWSLVVLGHILRHAFDVTLGQGVLLGVVYTFCSYAVVVFLFPIS